MSDSYIKYEDASSKLHGINKAYKGVKRVKADLRALEAKHTFSLDKAMNSLMVLNNQLGNDYDNQFNVVAEALFTLCQNDQESGKQALRNLIRRVYN